jgi:2-methylcitrate dehydratase PrpD
MTVTAQLAGFAAETTFGDLPADVVAAAKIVILDGIANAVAGSAEDVARKVADYTTPLGGAQQSTVVNRIERLPAGQAALTNGVAMHCLDYEVQGYPSAHGTSSIFPAVAAVAERESRSGADLLTSFVVGWDVQQRLRAGGEKGDMRGFHPPGIVGPVASAAAVSNLLGLDVERTTMAFGLSASRTGGLFGNNGTMTKATHPGNAARSGVESADLARLGVTSNPDILHVKRGYIAATMGGVFDDDLALDGLGSRFHLIDPGYSVKPFPAEIYMQWPLDAMTTLKRRTGIRLDDVTSIVIEPPVFRADLSRPYPATGLDGKFSYEYVVAAALVEPRVHIGSFTDAVRFSPEIERALSLISVRENPDIPHDKKTTWARVIVTTHDGTVLEEISQKYEGAIGRPMSAETHSVKVADCFEEGGASHKLQRVLDLVGDLESLPEFGTLMRLLAAD